MKEKTKLQIIQNIAYNLPLEDKFTVGEKVAVWTSYLMEMAIFHICLLISITEPQLHINDLLSQYPSVEMGLFLARMVIPVIYFITKSSYIIPLIKLLQMTNIYLVRTQFCAIPLVMEALAEAFLTMRKEKRNINFDSRLQSKYFGTKIFAVYILLFSSFFTPNEEINKNPSAVFFTSIIYYVAACLDNVYSYRTKQILRNIALCPILMAIYFMCVPLVPVFNNFGMAAHSIVSLGLIFVIVTYASISDYSYNHEILHKKILNLESRDKLLYIWSLIYFCESPSHNDLICFIKTHQSKCFNSLCPLNFNQTGSKDPSNNSSKESIQKHLKTYLKKALERFASESDEIRRLFIYYRKEDDPKIVHLLREDDIYEKIEEIRISKNLGNYNDPSLQYEQMKEIEEETLSKVKLYLNHYDYFLSYINKETIRMETSEEIIREIIKLKSYFLSFKANSIPQIKQQNFQGKGNRNSKMSSKGYQKLDFEAIPIKKMTMKTVVLVNFMRKIYFSLPCLEKEQFAEKKLTYISEDFQQSPILIVSAEAYNLGKIVNWNSMAQKILLYSTKELRSKFVNDLVPKCMHKIHEKIFMRSALSIELGEVRKELSAFVFCFTKSSYTEIFDVKIQGANSISGNKWVVEMKHHFQNQAVLVCDEYRTVIGVNKNAINFGISQNVTGQTMSEDLFNQLVEKRKEKVTLDVNVEPIEGMKIDKETKWQLVNATPTIEDMPKFYIFLIQHSNEIERLTLSRFGKTREPIDYENTPEPTNGFQINFDPYYLKFTNKQIAVQRQTDLDMIWQDNRTVDEGEMEEMQYQNSAQKKGVNLTENIHEMIYFDKKLEFKENYEVATEFETHPHYLPNGRMSGTKNFLRINVSKENFIENVEKIKNKVPSYLCRILTFCALMAIVWIVALAFRFMQFKNLYNAAQEKELINQEIINRKNIIDNIGSLALYYSKVNVYPSIWDRYLTNNWTFAQLFVQIEYTNSKINKINSEIGALVNKNYVINGKSRSLASYFESLSIEASLQSTGQLNVTQFILEIVNDIDALEDMVEGEFNNFYANLDAITKRNIMIIDICQLAACLITALVCHLILKKSYEERVYIFKSLSVIEEEEIYRIQKSLTEHREHIKNNDLDAIRQEDYSEPIDSQNIPHSKKMLNSYFKDRNFCFYVILFCMVAVCSGIFGLTQVSIQETSKIELVEPFINIIGEQRDSMTKLYLNLIAETRNSSWVSQNILTNIRMFQINKKSVIDSLIAKQFSDTFLNFYNNVWFNPCDALGVSQQCANLFAGILSDNLDYNFVYILTEIEKVVDYKSQSLTPPLSLDPQFVKDVNTEIETSFKKMNFLIFDLMIRLHDQFTTQNTAEIEVLFDSISRFNLIQFMILIISSVLLMVMIFLFTYWIKDLQKMTLEMVTTVVPYSILMRNEYFADWYKMRFLSMY